MKKILVTGAGGYIGRHVIKALADSKSLNVISVSRSEDIGSGDVKAYQKDIFEDIDNAYELFDAPDVVLHLAWEDGFNHNSETHLINLYKHYKFLTTLGKNGVKHITIMGSMHEVGYWEGAIDENTPTNPLSLYGIAKNSLRQAIQVYCQSNNITFQWLRGFYVFGDDERNHSIFTKIHQMEKQGSRFFPATDGNNKYDFLDIDELAKQITAAVSQEKINGIINCCSGKPVSLKEKINEYIRINDYKIKPQFGAYPSRIYDSPAIWGDDRKIKMILHDSQK